MNFKNPTLEQLFKSYKYARNNTIKIFEAAEKQNFLEFRSSSTKQKRHIFQPVIFQFQCIITTTDAYIRKITNNKNKSYGVYVSSEGEVIPKDKLKSSEIKVLLKEQLEQLESMLKNFDNRQTERYVDKIATISNHEYLHQGELILMFREGDADLPESFVKAWAL